MELNTAVSLIRTTGLQTKDAVHWVDLGCGTGLFTRALSTLLPAGGSITAIDRNASSLNKVTAVPGIKLEKIKADFIADALPLQALDGVLMANALHFVQHKKSFIEKLQTYTAQAAALLIVEYDTDRSNPWVPYPLTVAKYEQLFNEMGYTSFTVISKVPSRFGRADITGMWIGR